MVGFVQGRFGTPGNFEVVAPRGGGGLIHFWRNNSHAAMPWSEGGRFGGSQTFTDASLIQSTYGNPGNLEVIARRGNQLAFFWRDSGPAFQWNGPFVIASGVSGSPSLIQGRFGNPGNFELVAPLASGGLGHWWRNNSDPQRPWSGVTRFGGSDAYQDAALIQSNFGNPGNLEVVARRGNQLVFFWRDSGPNFRWSGGGVIASGVSGSPSLIQGRFGSPGNFEVVAPRAGGGLVHFWRNNSDPQRPWSGATRFGGSEAFTAAALVQSNYGNPGNLEVIAQRGDRLVHFWRDSGPAFRWSGDFDIRQSACIRVHFKTLVARTTAINTFMDTQFDAMLALFAGSGIACYRGTTEDLSGNTALANLVDLDVGGCFLGQPTAEHNTLFANRNNAAANDLVIYVVRSLVNGANPTNFLGCATHPNNRPGAAMVRANAAWLLAHEVGHVLGLRHVATTPATNTDFLMFPNVGWTNTPPDISGTESSTMRQSGFIIRC
jgi:hypothetical protein